MKYLTAEQALFIHSRLIDETGGMHGVRDISLLRSAIARPFSTFDGKDLYPDIYSKSAALTESLIKNHPFIDGNKRTAITGAGIFLQLNGFLLNSSQEDLEKFAIGVAVGKVVFRSSVRWFEKHTVRK